MSPRRTKLKLSVIIFFMVFIYTGCTRLKQIDQKLGELLNNPPESILTSSNINNDKQALNYDYKNLTVDDKQKIEEWLKKNKLNRFGDPMDTYYAGGTPLFNEKTGQSIERFSYILKNHPELITILNR